ncbi:MAG: hypothetical protein RIS20_940 [Bacteroidota bacterium]
MNRFFEIIKYTWKAKGRHGIHSPFVYDLVDTGFKLGVSKKKLAPIATELGISISSLKLLYQLSQHLNFQHIWTNLEKKDLLQSFLLQQDIHSEIHSLKQLEETKNELHAGLIFLDCSKLSNWNWDTIIERIPMLNEQTLIVLLGIRRDKQAFLKWNDLVSDAAFHFTADLYQFGLLSKRSFQEKEHFVLRY